MQCQARPRASLSITLAPPHSRPDNVRDIQPYQAHPNDDETTQDVDLLALGRRPRHPVSGDCGGNWLRFDFMPFLVTAANAGGCTGRLQRQAWRFVLLSAGTLCDAAINRVTPAPSTPEATWCHQLPSRDCGKSLTLPAPRSPSAYSPSAATSAGPCRSRRHPPTAPVPRGPLVFLCAPWSSEAPSRHHPNSGQHAANICHLLHFDYPFIFGLV